jgi:hypothetical protein
VVFDPPPTQMKMSLISFGTSPKLVQGVIAPLIVLSGRRLAMKRAAPRVYDAPAPMPAAGLSQQKFADVLGVSSREGP